MHNTEAEQHKKKKKTTKTKKKAGSSSSSSSTTFYTEAGVAARLKLLENENVKQASSRARTALHMLHSYSFVRQQPLLLTTHLLAPACQALETY